MARGRFPLRKTSAQHFATAIEVVAALVVAAALALVVGFPTVTPETLLAIGVTIRDIMSETAT
jgi:hypothetical protein